jgi:DNA-binding NarL/FixJ family response regulator
MTHTVLLADDHPIFLRGLVELIATTSAFSVVGQAENGEQAVAGIQRLQPDIAILDLAMPGMGGLDVLLKAQQWAYQPRFVILTLYDDAGYLNKALEYGAMGYVLKDNAESEIINCLRMISTGKHYISPSVSWQLVENRGRDPTRESIDSLTPTERKVFDLVSEFRSNQEIARLLCVSIRTVQNHRAHICQKLGLRGPQALTRFATRIQQKRGDTTR